MNLVNWLLVFIVSLLSVAVLVYVFSQRRNRMWSILSLTAAGLVSLSLFATLFVQSPVVTSAMQVADQTFTCSGTPALVRVGAAVTITGRGEAGSTVTVQHGATTLATTTIDSTGVYALPITLRTPGVQSVSCQVESTAGQVQSITLSFVVIGQTTATNTPAPTAAPTATKAPAPTATDTPAPTATDTPTVAPPVIDLSSIPGQVLPGETFRLRGTADSGARVRVAINNSVIAGAIAGAEGNWRTTVGFAAAGTYTLTAQLVEDDTTVAESEPVLISVIAPTSTPVPTATNTPAPTATNTLAPTATNTPAPTATNTPAPTATNTPEPTATNTPEPTATNTPEPTATNTPEPTATNTPAPTATNTPEPTATNTPAPTATNTPAPTATNTPEPTATNTLAPTATNTPEPTATNTPAPTATNTPEPTATNTLAPTATNIPTSAPPVVDMTSIPEQILPGETFRLRGTAAGDAKVNIMVNDKTVGGAVAGPNGNWRTTIGFAAAGTYTLTAQLVENDVVTLTSDPIIITVAEPVVLQPTATATTAAAAAPIDTTQPVTDTVVAPDALPGTGGDGSQGLPWVIMLLLFGALFVLGKGRLSNKPAA